MCRRLGQIASGLRHYGSRIDSSKKPVFGLTKATPGRNCVEVKN